MLRLTNLTKDKAVTSAKSALDVAKQGVIETTTSSETMYDVPKATYAPALSQGISTQSRSLANGTGTADAVDTEACDVPYSDPKSWCIVTQSVTSTYRFTLPIKVKTFLMVQKTLMPLRIADFQHLTKDQQIRLATM